MPSPWEVRSSVAGLAWPGIPPAGAQAALALLFQLEQTQWLAPAELEQRQMLQLDLVLRHAQATVPFYREHWKGAYDPGAPVTPQGLAALPLLSRRHLQENFEALKSTRIPPGHGQTAIGRTSGSSGTPVRVLKTQLMDLFWRVLTLRDHLWRRRDLMGKLAIIRALEKRAEHPDWGAATRHLLASGPAVTLGLEAGIGEMLRWLEAERPDCLLTYPSLLRELLAESARQGLRPAMLRDVRTMGELLPEGLRESCRQTWDASLTDMYSADEVGYLALQCPEQPHYHLQSESLVVEILDDAGKPCAPGATGRVVATGLHNFAMPLVRYDIGDFAEAGAPCPCGRGLPVVRRIVGRVNNMLLTAEGGRYWPLFSMRELQDMVPVRQHQFVQTAFDLVEARLVTEGRLSAALEEQACLRMASRLPAGVRVKIVYVDAIARTAGGKFEDFVSRVARPERA